MNEKQLGLGALALVVGLAIGPGLAGCDSSSGDEAGGGGGATPTDTSGADGTVGLDGSISGLDGGNTAADAGADTGPGGTAECPSNSLPDDSFWVIFGHRGRITGDNDDEFDLYVMDQDGMNPLDPTLAEPLSVTSFSLTGQTFRWCQDSPELAHSCKYGCFVDRAMNWIAVAVPVPSKDVLDPASPLYDPTYECLGQMDEIPDPAKGYTVQLGKFDPTLHITMVKGALIKNVADFEFAGGKMFYSRLQTCVGPSCTYDILMRDLDKDVNKENLLTTFPPDATSIKDSIYKGHFQVSDDGEVVTLLNPTIRSQSYWTWVEGKGIQMLDEPLCSARQDGKCVGTGSEYTDEDPVAISPDHKVLQSFSVAEGKLRAWVYKTMEKTTPLWSNLTSIPSGSNYKNNICMHMTESWQYAYVKALPRFAPDGDSVYYLGFSDCNDLGKPETDILELPLDVIGSGKPIGDGDIRNVTNNPKDSTVENTVIETFDLCPGGKTLVLSATPRVNKQGQVLKNDSQTAKKDTEIYYIGTDGCGKKQITTDIAFETVAPMCVSPKKL